MRFLPAHPRACGENLVHRFPNALAYGSSPRVRGKRAGFAPCGSGRGLIPARAGKTGCATPWNGARWAHPRACGENPVPATTLSRSVGSSPRVRGKPFPSLIDSLRSGLIPARAGKTRRCASPSTPRRAHPRACGENVLDGGHGGAREGSSPRVRGKQLHAEAANTLLLAHPRACGENRFDTDPLLAADGSSPRVRGKPRRRDPQPVDRRLIPARAGKTDGADVRLVHVGAHPRACGENLAVRSGRGAGAGSSPRVRGKPYSLAV